MIHFLGDWSVPFTGVISIRGGTGSEVSSDRLGLCVLITQWPPVRQQFGQTIFAMGGQTLEPIGQPRTGVHMVQLAGAEERARQRRVSGGVVRAGERIVLAAHRPRTRSASPNGTSAGHRFALGRLNHVQIIVDLYNGFEHLQDRSGPILSHLHPLGCGPVADGPLDGVHALDLHQHMHGQHRVVTERLLEL